MGDIFLGLFGASEQITKLISAFAKNIIDLRKFAILSNVFGVILNSLSGAWPQFLQSLLEIPMHSWRLQKTLRAMREVDRAKEPTYAIEIIRKLATPQSFKTGDVIFTKGAVADAAYVVDCGSVKVVEHDVMLKSGALFGEMGLFTGETGRTATIVALEDVTLSRIAYDQFETLYRKNPEVGFAVMRIMSVRFASGASQRSVLQQ
jgi:CRP-like cAMP-binding protein